MTSDTSPVIQITNTQLERAVAHSRDRVKYGPRVAAEMHWQNHPTYGEAWTRQTILDVKRQRAREYREAGYWEVFLDRSGMPCGILLYAHGERLAKALSNLLGLDYCLPGEGWLNDEAWMRSYKIGWGAVLRYRLVGLMRCRRFRMRIASGVRTLAEVWRV
jgi:hypothetical protein